MTTPAALTFTAHNIVLPDGSQTRPGTEITSRNGIARAALRDLQLAFPIRAVPPRVADLGCLEGGYAAAFARRGFDVTGYEIRDENMECCQYVAGSLNLPNLRFVQADVRDVAAGPDEWDAVFCCGLLYHLENPVAFLRQLGRRTRRLLILQTHYSTRPDTVHESYHGHWYPEGKGRWASWGNDRSFWLTRRSLLAVLKESGFDLVFEQADFLEDVINGVCTEPDQRSMFAGFKC